MILTTYKTVASYWILKNWYIFSATRCAWLYMCSSRSHSSVDSKSKNIKMTNKICFEAPEINMASEWVKFIEIKMSPQFYFVANFVNNPKRWNWRECTSQSSTVYSINGWLDSFMADKIINYETPIIPVYQVVFSIR